MTDSTHAPIDLTALTGSLIEEARAHSSGRAAKAVMSGSHLRAVVIALQAGAELAEHDAPAAATLQVLVGAVTLLAGEERWDLGRGCSWWRSRRGGTPWRRTRTPRSC